MFGVAKVEVETNPNGKAKSKSKAKSPYINYSSPDELVTILGRLKQPVPTKNGNYVVPNFIFHSKRKVEILDKKGKDFTTGKGSIESYLNENPTTPIKSFIKTLIEYRKFSVRITTFGENFLANYKNPITKRFHTIFRQMSAITGRLQSGNKKEGYFNSQNIPADKKYRECFKSKEDYNIITCDLSGAEAVIMIDKARDERFYEFAIKNDDAHSPLAQAVWRAIGNMRVENWSDNKNHGFSPAQLTVLEVSKTKNKEVRTLFKNVTFAAPYGVHFKKYAKMLNITLEEAKLGLRVMRTMIPKTFKMVEAQAKFAQANGYIILNYRTNSRIYYPQLLKAIRENSDCEFSYLSQVDGSSRNAPIQGTQADMVKEAIVEIGKEIKRQKLDMKLIGTIHDELVYKSHKSIHLVEFPNEQTKETELVSPGEFVKKWMIQVANRYLSFITMSAEVHVGETWTK